LSPRASTGVDSRGRYGGLFTVNATGNHHSTVTFAAGIQYGRGQYINVLNQSHHVKREIQSIRIVELPYSGTNGANVYADRAVQVYVKGGSYCDVIVDNSGVAGWIAAPFTDTASGLTTDCEELLSGWGNNVVNVDVYSSTHSTTAASGTDIIGKTISTGRTTTAAIGINTHTAFSTTTGYFTAPCDGTYMFAATITTNNATSNYRPSIGLRKGTATTFTETQSGLLVYSSPNTYASGSWTGTLALKTGDQFYIGGLIVNSANSAWYGARLNISRIGGYSENLLPA
jgi:hypothetical protein